jgi:death-on-curing protein
VIAVRFLLRETVLALHTDQIDVFGGTHGIRDDGLLESAIAQPQASFAGEYLHRSLYDMAAAYLFHIVSNHPFLDGNKRTGYIAALVFLDVHGVAVDEEFEDMYEITMAVAEGRAAKVDVVAVLERRYPPAPSAAAP